LNYKIKYKNEFTEKAKKIFQNMPELVEDYKIIITLLSENPLEPSLMLQPIYGELRGNYYLNLSVDIQLIITIIKSTREVFLLDIGIISEEKN